MVPTVLAIFGLAAEIRDHDPKPDNAVLVIIEYEYGLLVADHSYLRRNRSVYFIRVIAIITDIFYVNPCIDFLLTGMLRIIL